MTEATEKWTTGPLIVDREEPQDQDNRTYVVWTRDPFTGQVATFHAEDISGEFPAKANATLYAASPALYEAAKALDEMWTKMLPTGPGESGETRLFDASTRIIWRNIRAALRLARGEEQ